MPYQIPQQLAYKEKIMFGLTFKQLVYAFVFGLLSLLFFKRIDGLYLKFTLVILSSALGVGFMFLNLAGILKDYWVFFRFQREVKGSKKLIKFLGIKDVRDSVIINSKNKKIAILKVRPINFTIKPKTERDAILASFQKFLNSLDFPTQILMNTESVELKTYLDSLKSRISEKTFEELFDKYKKHLEATVKDSKIMNRVFYIVIPESSDIQIQVDICLDRLRALNLKATRLHTSELKKLLIAFFKGSGVGELTEAISPESLLHGSDFLNNNGQYNRTIYASGYPRMVEGGFLDRVVSSLGDFDLSMHIKPYPINTMLIALNRELQKQRGDLYSMQLKGIINPSLEIQYTDTRKTLENLQKGKERLFNISLYINCKAKSLKELDLLTKKVESELNSIMIMPKVATLKMLQGFQSVAPLGIDKLNVNRNLTTDALSAFFPFTSQFLEADDTGVWLGLNKNKIPIIKDIFKLSNPNGVVLAQSGGGKSYFCKLLITRYLLNGTRTLVIDPQGEYRALTAYFGGQRVNLSRDSDTMINPLDLMGHDYTEKRLSLIDLMHIMLGELSDIQKAFIDKALTKTYRLKGINDNPDTWNNEPPILKDLLDTLKKMEKSATRLEQTTLSSLSNRLDMYVNGVFSFFNKKTNINFNNRFVCFDIGNLPSQAKPALMFLVLDYIYMKMKRDLDRKILLIDEAWSLLSRTEDAGYIFEIVKTCRKFNLGLLLINQEVEGLLNSKAGKSVLANSAYTMLMRQKPAVIDNICKTFNLSDSERNHLLTANVGEGLLIMEDDHSEIKVVASPEEHKIITTNADELNELSAKPARSVKGKNVRIEVDENKRFFRKAQLKKEEIDYLISKGYQTAKYKSLTKSKSEDFLLQPRHNESLTHLFMVYDIAEYLEKKGFEVKKYATKKPDIIFMRGSKKYAIEVETGANLTKVSRMDDKLKVLKDYDKWFFVVTNKNKVAAYRKFGTAIDLRFIRRQISKMLK